MPPAPGSAQWFREEVHAHDSLLKAWLRRQFPSIRDIEDLVQDSYLRLWKSPTRDEIHSAKSFLFRIARRLAIDHVRRTKASPINATAEFDDQSVLDGSGTAADALITQELIDRLADALAELPSHYREVIILHKIQGLSQKEAAARMGVPHKSVEKYVQRSLRQIGAYLRDHEVHGFSR